MTPAAALRWWRRLRRKKQQTEAWRDRMVPDGRGGKRPARGPHDYGEQAL